jgi:ASC-1-like (ASCH) protein
MNDMKSADPKNRKTWDARPGYSSFNTWKVGDFVSFVTSGARNCEFLNVRITHIDREETFSQLLKCHGISNFLPNGGKYLTIDQASSIYYAFDGYRGYEKKYGVFGFGFLVISDNLRPFYGTHYTPRPHFYLTHQ